MCAARFNPRVGKVTMVGFFSTKKLFLANLETTTTRRRQLAQPVHVCGVLGIDGDVRQTFQKFVLEGHLRDDFLFHDVLEQRRVREVHCEREKRRDFFASSASASRISIRPRKHDSTTECFVALFFFSSLMSSLSNHRVNCAASPFMSDAPSFPRVPRLRKLEGTRGGGR